MGLLSFIRRALSLSPRGVSEKDMLAGIFSPGRGHVSVDDALGHAPIWHGLNLITSYISKTELYIYKKGPNGRVRATEHPAYRLLCSRANGAMTAQQLRRAGTLHSLIYGNSYIHIKRDRYANPIALRLLEPCNVRFDEESEVYKVGETEISPWDMLHIRGLSRDGWCGIPVIEQLAAALKPGINARDFGASWYESGASMSGILQLPEGLPEQAQKNAMKDFADIMGKKTKHRVAILQDGAKFIPTSQNPVESQMIEAQLYDLLVCANVLNLPPHKLGHPSRTSYNSLESEEKAFINDSLDLWFCAWEDECNNKLLTEEQVMNGSHYCEFNRNQLLSQSKETRVRVAAQERLTGLTSTNRYLERENEQTIGPAGDVFWAPANMVPIDQVGLEAPKPEQAPANDTVQGPANDELRAEAMVMVIDRLQRLAKIEQTAVRKAAVKEDNFLEWLERFHGQQFERIVEALTPELRVFALVYGWPDAGLASMIASKVIERSRDELLSIAGRPRLEFAAAIEAFAGLGEEELRDIVIGIVGIAP